MYVTCKPDARKCVCVGDVIEMINVFNCMVFNNKTYIIPYLSNLVEMISMCNSNAYPRANNNIEARVITTGIKHYANSHIQSSASGGGYSTGFTYN